MVHYGIPLGRFAENSDPDRQSDGTGWAKSTTKTMLRRLEQKGCIAYREGEKAREYYAVVKREEVVESETNSFLNRIYNGSLGLLVNTLVKKQEISDAEMEELYRIIKEAKEKK